MLFSEIQLNKILLDEEKRKLGRKIKQLMETLEKNRVYFKDTKDERELWVTYYRPHARTYLQLARAFSEISNNAEDSDEQKAILAKALSFFQILPELDAIFSK